MNPTVTPEPVRPSDLAVLAPGVCESAWIVSSACGLSWTWPGGAQAPGRGDVPAPLAPVLACPVLAGGPVRAGLTLRRPRCRPRQLAQGDYRRQYAKPAHHSPSATHDPPPFSSP